MLAAQRHRVFSGLRAIPPKWFQIVATRTVSSKLLPSTCDSWSLGSEISHQKFLTKLELIRSKLKKHLGKQYWPRLTHVDVGGVLLKLPIKAETLLANRIPPVQADLAYLAGFFDGDGCVSPKADASGCHLVVGQQVASVTLLIAFLCRFGGGIYMLNSGKGSARPQVRWQIWGTAARAAASDLHAHCLVKREQLEIAMTWPTCMSERQDCILKLKELKRDEPVINMYASTKRISWPYFTGFFDAEGCIRISATSKRIVLAVSQRDVPILNALQAFLLDQLPAAGGNVVVRTRLQTSHVLEASTKKLVLHILEEMLINGLLVKRRTAEHVCNSIDFAHDVLRGAEPNVKGNQCFLKRLDAEGCLRARNIQRLQTKYARVKGRSLIAFEVKNRLDDAKLEHAILNAMNQIQRLRSEIALLRSRAGMAITCSLLSPFGS